MSNLKSEIRMYIAEKLLSLAYNLAPENNNGKNLKDKITNYFTSITIRLTKK